MSADLIGDDDPRIAATFALLEQVADIWAPDERLAAVTVDVWPEEGKFTVDGSVVTDPIVTLYMDLRKCACGADECEC